jgi:predicted ferric reductase
MCTRRLTFARYHQYQAIQTEYSPPRGRITKIFAFAKALSILPFPRLCGIGTLSSFTCGQVILITLYTSAVALLLVSVRAPWLTQHFIDDVAFRAAWITLTQLPLVYLLATKRGPLNILATVSYERINWIHRWLGRGMFLTATVHMAIMMQSIPVADIMGSRDKVMRVVRYGVGAYGCLVWIALTSMLPLRKTSYRLFYINHWISTLIFLWIIFNHVPKYARVPIYSAAGILAVDRCVNFYLFAWHNVSMRPLRRRLFSKFRKGPARKSLTVGHYVKMSAPSFGRPSSPFATSLDTRTKDSVTIIRVCNVPFSWKPGQHVRLYLPRLGLLEVHPFTPATCGEVIPPPLPPRKNRDPENNQSPAQYTNSPENDMVFFIKPQEGLTRRLANYYFKWLSLPCPNASQPCSSLTAFVDGPYGTPPSWENYETLVLVATSTGVSFILAIVDYLEQMCLEGDERLRTKSIRFLWSVRHIDPQLDASISDMLARHSVMLRDSGVDFKVEFFVSCTESRITGAARHSIDPFAHLRRVPHNSLAGRPLLRIYNPDEIYQAAEDVEFSETETSSVYESVASSTLIDSEEELELSDTESIPDRPPTPWWTRVPSFSSSSRGTQPDTNSCECHMIQNHRRSIKPIDSSMYIDRSYGCRPDLAFTIPSSVGSGDTNRTMVAVCSNNELTSQARGLVAQMNFDFAMGRRGRGADIFTECFS